MTVVDISKYQGVISAAVFTLWRQSGVTRVILKIGGGDSGRYEDSHFAENLSNANAAGMPTDGYWFNGTTDPVQDAKFAHTFIPAKMRIWWDVENEGSMPHWGDPSLNAAARTGVALGHPAGAYMSSSVTFGGWPQSIWMPLWVAGYGFSSLPPIGPGWKAVLWQYTSTGHEPGYNSYLDISDVQQGWANLNGSTPINPLGGILLPALLKHPNGSIGFVSDGGELDPISDMNEVNALVASGIVGGTYVNLPNPQIWDLLTTRTNRLRAKNTPPVTVPAPVVNVDEAAIVKGVLAALPSGVDNAAQVAADVVAAIRSLSFGAK